MIDRWLYQLEDGRYVFVPLNVGQMEVAHRYSMGAERVGFTPRSKPGEWWWLRPPRPIDPATIALILAIAETWHE